MDKTIEQCLKDCEEIERYKNDVIQAAKLDFLHIDNPQRQIETLSVMASGLLADNENGKFDELIGFYANVARSLKKLIQLQNKIDALWKI